MPEGIGYGGPSLLDDELLLNESLMDFAPEKTVDPRQKAALGLIDFDSPEKDKKKKKKGEGLLGGLLGGYLSQLTGRKDGAGEVQTPTALGGKAEVTKREPFAQRALPMVLDIFL